jgi:hypothetical protein
MRTLLILSILWLLAAPANIQAQSVKNERESAIRQEQMPSQALALLKPLLMEARNVHFYRETDGQQVSYECKLVWQREQYSIEFHQAGTLMDIEKLIPFRTIPAPVRKQMEAYLAEEYGRYKIERVQQQYPPEAVSGDLLEFLSQNNPAQKVYYEIELDGRSSSGIGTYEYLFDAIGRFISRRTIVRRALDNLLY